MYNIIFKHSYKIINIIRLLQYGKYEISKRNMVNKINILLVYFIIVRL